MLPLGDAVDDAPLLGVQGILIFVASNAFACSAAAFAHAVLPSAYSRAA